ncbi:Serine/threonine-protein kinase PK-1 [Enhygromyxa salina]|uniref:Serine/threonine-protein kinase PK-1 n=1 Tax=Enhygromyxa salina TaxID=215803 RepID=A0A2S9XCG0_9BACT|nr:serine/threonine-protein kinase [Enhygromyxa salina]PRP90544.1 Serine/threonine-protein kinase PK-1 [Enhygromyxa salina]
MVEFGRYELLRLIGRGGMGQVFEAWDTQLERRVAIKVLTAEHSDDLALREARCVARVAHPNVVSVHEVGRVDSLVFIAMELIDGPNLRQWLREQPRRWSDVLDQVIDAGRGLAAVHRAGLVHGDVKPGNVLVDGVVGRERRARIADFGLARVRSRVAEPALVAAVRRAAEAVETELVDLDHRRPLGEPLGLSQPLAAPLELEGSPVCRVLPSGASLPTPVAPVVGGTKPYMAPECLAGAPDDLTRADQYGLCATAWEALFGVRPYAGKSAVAILGSIAAERIERGHGRPRGMPRAIEVALLRGLSAAPERRWSSVEALVAALERGRDAPRRAALRGLVAAAVGLGLAGISIGIGSTPDPDRDPRESEPDVCAARLDPLGTSWDRRAEPEPNEELRAAGRYPARWLDQRVVEWAAKWLRAADEPPLESPFEPGPPPRTD